MRYKVTAYKSEDFEVEAENEDAAIMQCHPDFHVDYYDVEKLDDDDEEDD